uniref:NADH dehydrogenase subunit 6 n=1 Tax=Cryptolestes turcicus TaxID=1173687 RepID=A0A0U2MBF3_9CUCU|nr:NADH dehydrogenase subunit 6 [Cryptolestes turcicus]
MIMLFIFFISLMFMFLNHPLSMGLMLLLQTICISILSGIMMINFWYSYMIFLIMIGGMLVLFFMHNLCSFLWKIFILNQTNITILYFFNFINFHLIIKYQMLFLINLINYIYWLLFWVNPNYNKIFKFSHKYNLYYNNYLFIYYFNCYCKNYLYLMWSFTTNKLNENTYLKSIPLIKNY